MLQSKKLLAIALILHLIAHAVADLPSCVRAKCAHCSVPFISQMCPNACANCAQQFAAPTANRPTVNKQVLTEASDSNAANLGAGNNKQQQSQPPQLPNQQPPNNNFQEQKLVGENNSIKPPPPPPQQADQQRQQENVAQTIQRSGPPKARRLPTVEQQQQVQLSQNLQQNSQLQSPHQQLPRQNLQQPSPQARNPNNNNNFQQGFQGQQQQNQQQQFQQQQFRGPQQAQSQQQFPPNVNNNNNNFRQQQPQQQNFFRGQNQPQQINNQQPQWNQFGANNQQQQNNFGASAQGNNGPHQLTIPPGQQLPQNQQQFTGFQPQQQQQGFNQQNPQQNQFNQQQRAHNGGGFNNGQFQNNNGINNVPFNNNNNNAPLNGQPFNNNGNNAPSNGQNTVNENAISRQLTHRLPPPPPPPPPQPLSTLFNPFQPFLQQSLQAQFPGLFPSQQQQFTLAPMVATTAPPPQLQQFLGSQQPPAQITNSITNNGAVASGIRQFPGQPLPVPPPLGPLAPQQDNNNNIQTTNGAGGSYRLLPSVMPMMNSHLKPPRQFPPQVQHHNQPQQNPAIQNPMLMNNNVNPLQQSPLIMPMGPTQNAFPTITVPNGGPKIATSLDSSSLYLNKLAGLDGKEPIIADIDPKPTSCPKQPGWEPCVPKDLANQRFRNCCLRLGDGCSQLCSYDQTLPNIQLAVLTGRCPVAKVADMMVCASGYEDASECCQQFGVLEPGYEHCRPYCNPSRGLPDSSMFAEKYRCLTKMPQIQRCFYITQKP